jgi:hypothetical protein
MGLKVIAFLDKLAPGALDAAADFLADTAKVQEVLIRLDLNGDGQLEIDEVLAADPLG